jgi:hypothetical protein
MKFVLFTTDLINNSHIDDIFFVVFVFFQQK